MAKFLVIKTFRDKEADFTIKRVGSSYVSDDTKRTDHLVKEGFLKSQDEQPATVDKEPVKVDRAVKKPVTEKAVTKTTKKRPSTRKKSGE